MSRPNYFPHGRSLQTRAIRSKGELEDSAYMSAARPRPAPRMDRAVDAFSIGTHTIFFRLEYSFSSKMSI